MNIIGDTESHSYQPRETKFIYQTKYFMLISIKEVDNNNKNNYINYLHLKNIKQEENYDLQSYQIRREHLVICKVELVTVQLDSFHFLRVCFTVRQALNQLLMGNIFYLEISLLIHDLYISYQSNSILLSLQVNSTAGCVRR